MFGCCPGHRHHHHDSDCDDDLSDDDDLEDELLHGIASRLRSKYERRDKPTGMQIIIISMYVLCISSKPMTQQRQRFGARQSLLQNLTIVQTVYLTSKSIDYNYILKILLLETTI